MLRKKIKRWGDNLVLVFTKEDEEVYNLEKGDYAEVSLDISIGEKSKNGKVQKLREK